MHELKIITEFSAAHSLRGLGNPPKLHGHNFKVEVILKVQKLNQHGVGADLRDVEKAIQTTISRLDHTHLNERPPWTEINPSLENLAAYLHKELSREINSETIQVGKINLWDSETYCAIYFEK